MTAPGRGEGRLVHRMLGTREVGAGGVTRILDCVRCPDWSLRCLFGAGTRAAALALPAPAGCMQVASVTEVAGAALAVLRGPGPLALAAGGRLELTHQPAEHEILCGRNVLLGSRIDETAAQVGEWLAFHARVHGADGALIIDRGPEADRAFAAALEAAARPLGMVVLLVRSPLPLGRPGEAALSHVFAAPAAPGRGRMTPPAPDPWRSGFGEPLIHEALKWRFLAAARAVLALDVTDILLPGGPNAFDLCQTAPGGVIRLAGTMTYPWRVRAGREARFGDHVCRQFDAPRDLVRWGVAPGRAGLDRLWRIVRVAETPADAPVARFARAMAIRVPGQPTARLVPRSALVEDEALLALARDHFGHEPVRAPAGAMRPPADKPHHALSTAIVTTMKNEGPFILEWVAYHRMIGVSEILVYTNDCTDGTDSFLALLERKGLCHHRANPWRPGGTDRPQHVALQAAESEPVIRDADWLICMDVDEFINVRIGDGTLAALYAAAGEANMISLTWRLFGDSGVCAFADRPVIAQFDRCAPELVRKPHQAWGFKTLFRNTEIFRKFGVHRPKGLNAEHWDKIRWLNGSGRPMPQGMLRNGWRSTVATYGYDWAQLNHYAVRSPESFLVKRDRGRVNHVDRDQGVNYWFRMNHNSDRDTSIQRMLPRLEAEMGRLLADPEIRAAHEDCVARHRARIAELLARPDQRALYDELTGERMRRLTRMQAHFGAAVFSAGPQVIPDEIALNPDLPPDFFFTVEHAGEANH
ncbi:MAG: glycosyltransferase family 2 protein [Rhodobacteraceae bacterium]|nr:glycosyltransferase family 2 protein [Paracoccaceae bacterium]